MLIIDRACHLYYYNTFIYTSALRFYMCLHLVKSNLTNNKFLFALQTFTWLSQWGTQGSLPNDSEAGEERGREQKREEAEGR